MISIKDLTENRNAFGKISNAAREKQIKALRYIELVSNQANIDISDWDIQTIFKATGKQIVTTPREINKRLFEHYEQTKSQIKQKALLDLIKDEQKIIKSSKAAVGRVMKNMKENVRYYEERLKLEPNNDYAKRDLARQQAQLLNLEAVIGNSQLVRDIAKVVANGFWKFQDITGKSVKFITTKNIILFEKNPRAGIDVQKDMGTYQCIIDFITLRFEVKAFKGNTILSNAYIHPYISGRDVCLGNAGTYMEKARQERNLPQMLEILGIALSSYSSAGGPYTTLSAFIDPAREGMASRKIEFTEEARKYYAAQSMGSASVIMEIIAGNVKDKQTSNGLAKTMGRTPNRRAQLADPEDYGQHDDEDYDDEYA